MDQTHVQFHIQFEFSMFPTNPVLGLGDYCFFPTPSEPFERSDSSQAFSISSSSPLFVRSATWLSRFISWPLLTLNNEVNLNLQEPTFDNTNFQYPQWVNDSLLSLQNGTVELCQTGVGGTYFVRSDNPEATISVFKPIDEEPGAPNNPKKTSFVPLLTHGSGALREVAAYKIDRSFAGVPETYLIEANIEGTKKIGSLQKYIENDGDCSDTGASKFSVDDVHRIGIFDVRVLNMDRNDENLLVLKVSENEWKLIPIDHTYTFPDKIDSYFTWQFWSQTKKPFSKENLIYIKSIDVQADTSMLFEFGLDRKSIFHTMVSTLLLQKAASRGMTLFQISSMVSGPKNDLTEIISNIENQIDSDFLDNNQTSINIFKKISESMVEKFLDSKL